MRVSKCLFLLAAFELVQGIQVETKSGTDAILKTIREARKKQEASVNIDSFDVDDTVTIDVQTITWMNGKKCIVQPNTKAEVKEKIETSTKKDSIKTRIFGKRRVQVTDGDCAGAKFVVFASDLSKADEKAAEVPKPDVNLAAAPIVNHTAAPKLITPPIEQPETGVDLEAFDYASMFDPTRPFMKGARSVEEVTEKLKRELNTQLPKEFGNNRPETDDAKILKWQVKEVAGDGNCLYTSIAEAFRAATGGLLYTPEDLRAKVTEFLSDQQNHNKLTQMGMTFFNMMKSEVGSVLHDSDVPDMYLTDHRKWGGLVEMSALTHLYPHLIINVWTQERYLETDAEHPVGLFRSRLIFGNPEKIKVKGEHIKIINLRFGKYDPERKLQGKQNLKDGNHYDRLFKPSSFL